MNTNAVIGSNSHSISCLSSTSNCWLFFFSDLSEFHKISPPGNVLLTHHSRSSLLVCDGVPSLTLLLERVRLMHYSFLLRRLPE